MPSSRAERLTLVGIIVPAALGLAYGIFATRLPLLLSVALGVAVMVAIAGIAYKSARVSAERRAEVEALRESERILLLAYDAQRVALDALRQEALPDAMVMRAYLRNVGG